MLISNEYNVKKQYNRLGGEPKQSTKSVTMLEFEVERECDLRKE